MKNRVTIVLPEDDKDLIAVTKLYGETHEIEAIQLEGHGDIDLTKLNKNESVCWGDGETYYFLLTATKPHKESEKER